MTNLSKSSGSERVKGLKKIRNCLLAVIFLLISLNSVFQISFALNVIIRFKHLELNCMILRLRELKLLHSFFYSCLINFKSSLDIDILKLVNHHKFEVCCPLPIELSMYYNVKSHYFFYFCIESGFQ